jgi:hypothetical protein
MKIPIKVIEPERVYFVNKTPQLYRCANARCNYTSPNKATAIGHMRMMHGYTDSQAITALKAR